MEMQKCMEFIGLRNGSRTRTAAPHRFHLLKEASNELVRVAPRIANPLPLVGRERNPQPLLFEVAALQQLDAVDQHF